LPTGSFQRSGPHLRITARLIDLAQGEALADAKVDGRLEDVFALQDGIVRAFARELNLTPAAGTGRAAARETKDLDAYQKRPKRRFIGARAEEYRFARYVEDWRLKVERIGNLNYPEAARSQKLYGSLLLTTGIRADGSIESIVVERSSGKRVLDLAAAHIVQMAGPYSPFPPDIRRDTDILYITRTWTFAPGDSLTSQ